MNRKSSHKSRNQKTSRYVMGALPTPERHRQNGGLRYGFVRAEKLYGTLIPRYRSRWASPLDLYRDRKIIDDTQHKAGLEFGRAYHRAASSISACHERTRLYGTVEETADAYSGSPFAQALAYIKQAYAALTVDSLNAVIEVCAYERPVDNAARLGSLSKGLSRLAETWGMASNEMCIRRSD